MSGYCSQFYYDSHDWDAHHEYPDVSTVHLGQTVRAYLTFLSPQEHAEKVHLGKLFLIREGNKVVAYSVVLSVLDLEASAKRLRD
ncbi:MAG: elongation factor Tu [Candidatus Competibacteraceae bacterium]|nr:elongation factor Tu [Candidatus Competibacteraceae bacterium]